MSVKPGEAVRIDCPDCMAEFEVTYEPKAKGMPDKAKGIEPMDEIAYCPACGGSVDPEEADDDFEDDDEE